MSGDILQIVCQEMPYDVIEGVQFAFRESVPFVPKQSPGAVIAEAAFASRFVTAGSNVRRIHRGTSLEKGGQPERSAGE